MPSLVSYAPDEPQAVIIKERGVLSGMGLGLAAWGILLTLTVQCVPILYSGLSRRNRVKNGSLLAYVLIMFSLGTAAIFCHLHWVQQFLIDNRNFPGGPLAYDAAFYANTGNIAGVACYFIMNWMADGLLLWRLYVIYNSRVIFAVFPLLMYLTAIGLSIVDLYTLATPGNSMFSGEAINFGLLYWSFSIALNVIVTAAIVGRLLYMRARVSSLSGIQHGSLYISISAMLIESAALYTITAIVFLIGYSLQNVLQFAAEPLEILQGVAPLMIILRVARGTAIDDTTTATMTTSSGRTDISGRGSDKRTHKIHAISNTTGTTRSYDDSTMAPTTPRAVRWPDDELEMSDVYVEKNLPMAV